MERSRERHSRPHGAASAGDRAVRPATGTPAEPPARMSVAALAAALSAGLLAFGAAAVPVRSAPPLPAPQRGVTAQPAAPDRGGAALTFARDIRSAERVLLVPERLEIHLLPAAGPVVAYAIRDGALWRRNGTGPWRMALAPRGGRVELRVIGTDGAERPLRAMRSLAGPGGRVGLRSLVLEVVRERTVPPQAMADAASWGAGP